MPTLTSSTATGRGRHSGRIGIRSFFSPRSMIMATITLLLAVGVAVIATGGSYALWNKSVPTGSAASITSGTANLTVSTLSLSTTLLAPGRTIYGSAALVNTGDVPLALTATLSAPTSSTAFSQAVTLGFSTAATAAACTGAAPTSTATFASAAAAGFGTLPITATSASPLYLCVSLTLASTAPAVAQGQSASTFGIAVSGVQS
ncbi:MAG: hypothetical protein JWN09_2717 [Microbacteriaceae bacterium]|jgi:hypothetical protein|nr:hypothetical protein [Microbacteriaceae bacterium]